MEKRRMRSALRRYTERIRRTILTLVAVAAVGTLSAHLYADEPYARHRDYDLQHSRIALRFDVQEKNVKSISVTKASRPRASISFFPTRITPTGPRKFGRRANRRTRAFTCPLTTIPMTVSPPKRF